jgi:transcriptional regulator with XRE-family HTH domain
VSLSELSRRSGIGKGTISELENDRRGARLDTLFALTTALGAPLGALLPDGAAETEPVAGASICAVLLDRWTISSGLVEVYRATVAPERQDSLAHAARVEETVTVVRGRVRVGPVGSERELGEGQSLRYSGAIPHMFQARGRSAEVVLLMHYPQHLAEKGSIRRDR